VLEDQSWKGPYSQESHTRLGPSIMPDCLQTGDWLARSPTGGLFLLSPNLTNSPLAPKSPLPEQWAVLEQGIRDYFSKQDFTEARTPLLVPSPGVDHCTDFLKVQGVASKKKWFLPTSPEIHLKKMLCLGYTKVFEISRSFRDDFVSPYHQPEFSMLEWYRAFGDLNDLLDDFEKLVVRLKKGADVGPEMSPHRYTVRSLFKHLFSFQLSPETTMEEMRSLLTSQSVEYRDEEDWDDLFHRIFFEKIEPFLKTLDWVYILDWPKTQASLARVENGWAQRVEIYFEGLEIANGYLEENSPQKNREIFQMQKEKRASSGREPSGGDSRFFRFLEVGMPPAAGIAMGVDRFFMIISGEKKIQTTRFFPEPESF